MRISNNLMAMNTHRQLSINNNKSSKSIEKLSSGQRINRAGDDAAGLAISEKMRAQIRGLDQASRNAQDGISLIQTAEGALNETQAILQRMRELAVQSANDTNVAADRSALQNEVNQLALEITRISNNTEFNERKLLNGGLQSGNLGELTFQIGANAFQNLQLGIRAMDAFSLGVAGLATNYTLAGTGDVTAATVTGNAAAVVDGNVVT
ncbi:MAG TPA: flagellin, partial [Clostridiales bacterium]|nr:flagellin [Clostridiales bacterium]